MSRVRLGELLLSRGWCTREELHRAWEHKVVYGDRLGTNLLALGILDEARLAAALGAQHGVHAGHGAVFHVDPAAVKLVPAHLAQRHGVIPHHVADRTLYLLMRDPSDLRAVDDIRFATRLKVHPIVVCEARLWRLLTEHYSQKAPLRPNPLDQLDQTARARAASAASAAVTVEKPKEDLVSEDDFAALYARLTGAEAHDLLSTPPATATSTAPATTSQTAATQSAPAAPQTSAPFEDDVPAYAEAAAPPVVEVPDWAEDTRPIRLRLVPGTEVTEASEAPAPSLAEATPSTSTSSRAAVLSAPVASADDWQHQLEVTAPMRAVARHEASEEIELVEVADADPDTLPPDFGRDFGKDGFMAPPPTIAAPIDWSPLRFDDAVAALRVALDRDDIARIVLRAARARFARACVLTVYPHAFIGWQGVGDGFENDKITDIAVPRTAQSVFSLVADSRAHYLGPLQRFVAHGAWVKATGKKIPKSLAVLPVLVHTRVVNLIVVDNGHDQHVGSDVGELLILARHIASSYEALIQQV